MRGNIALRRGVLLEACQETTSGRREWWCKGWEVWHWYIEHGSESLNSKKCNLNNGKREDYSICIWWSLFSPVRPAHGISFSLLIWCRTFLFPFFAVATLKQSFNTRPCIAGKCWRFCLWHSATWPFCCHPSSFCCSFLACSESWVYLSTVGVEVESCKQAIQQWYFWKVLSFSKLSFRKSLVWTYTAFWGVASPPPPLWHSCNISLQWPF